MNMAPKRRRKPSFGQVGEYNQPGDHVSVLIRCTGDETYLLVDDENKGLWFPGALVKTRLTWEQAATEATKPIFPRPVEVNKLIRLNRLWSPNFNQFICHSFLAVDIAQEVKSACKLKPDQKWMTSEQIESAKEEAPILRTAKALDVVRHYEDILSTPVYQEGSAYLNTILHEVEPAEASDASAGSLSAKEQLAAELAFEKDRQRSKLSKAMAPEHEYQFANHVVTLRRTGDIEDVHTLWEEDEALAESSKASQAPGLEASGVRAKFSPKSLPNQLLSALNFYRWGPKKGLTKDAYSWGGSDMVTYGKNVIKLSHMVTTFLKMSPRLLRLQPPLYILGDIHGKLSDLTMYEKALWRAGPGLCPADILFLGDFVDRGMSSIEVVTYIFAIKCLSPEKVHLVRGNHETRRAQKRYGFYNECLQKFGLIFGEEVWEAVNKAFDCLPIAAVVDGKLFCAHGGIPPSIGGYVVSNYDKDIPCPMPDPGEVGVAWETLWCDPVEYRDVNTEMDVDKEGFGENIKRNTAHVFTPDALEHFLQANGLSHVIRAHEASDTGFEVKQFGKLVTICSSSRYGGKINEPVCALVDKNKIRIIRIDTATSPAATDTNIVPGAV